MKEKRNEHDVEYERELQKEEKHGIVIWQGGSKTVALVAQKHLDFLQMDQKWVDIL